MNGIFLSTLSYKSNFFTLIDFWNIVHYRSFSFIFFKHIFTLILHLFWEQSVFTCNLTFAGTVRYLSMYRDTRRVCVAAWFINQGCHGGTLAASRRYRLRSHGCGVHACTSATVEVPVTARTWRSYTGQFWVPAICNSKVFILY